jgi:hypothetical protein
MSASRVSSPSYCRADEDKDEDNDDDNDDDAVDLTQQPTLWSMETTTTLEEQQQ